MLPLLAETNPADLLKDPGFVQWVIYAIAAFMLWERIEKFLNRQKAKDVRVVEGEIDVGKKKRFADHDETTKSIREIKDTLERMQETSIAEHNTSRTAGENRVRAIAEVLDKETGEVKRAVDHLSERVEALTQALHEKVNGIALIVAEHKADINNLKTEGFRAWSQQQPRPKH